jgi:hypothetical protein
MAKLPLAKLPVIGDGIEKFMVKYEAGKAKQGVAARAVMEAVVKGVPQGCLIGGVSFSLQNMMNNPAMNDKMSPEQLKTMQQAKAMQPKTMAASCLAFSALFGTQFALTELIKHFRKEKDVWNVYAPV